MNNLYVASELYSGRVVCNIVAPNLASAKAWIRANYFHAWEWYVAEVETVAV